jgi:hypothetical protein
VGGVLAALIVVIWAALALWPKAYFTTVTVLGSPPPSRVGEAERREMHNRLVVAANTAAQNNDLMGAIKLYKQTKHYARDHCDRAFINISIHAAQETAKDISVGRLARNKGGEEFERRRDEYWMRDACDRP